MKLISIGEVYGVYKVKGVSNKQSSRHMPMFDCQCLVCGKVIPLSWTFLLKSPKINECMCESVELNREIGSEYKYIKRNWGKVCLCGSCKHMFNCVRHTLNAIDKSFMKKYSIDVVSDRMKRRNVILVYDCTKFEFDWGNKCVNLKHK